jgi:acyl carrier protein
MDELIADRVRRVLVDVLNVDVEQIQQDSSPDTVENWDSLNHINMVIALEQEFNVVFAADEIERLLTFKLIYERIHTKLSCLERIDKS